MRKLVRASIALLALNAGGSALAADMLVRARPAPPPPPVYNWTGCYVGAHAGGGTHHSEWIYDPEQGGNFGWVAGFQAGCNYQINQLLVGVEGELYWADLVAKSDTIDLNVDGRISHQRAENNGDATIALRLGYAFDRLLLYGKIGAAWADLRWTNELQDPSGFTRSTIGEKTVTGLLLGAGFEYAFLGNWTAKLEYNYINFGNPLIDFTNTECNGICNTTFFSETRRDTKQILKVGVNYKFDWGKYPVAARY